MILSGSLASILHVIAALHKSPEVPVGFSSKVLPEMTFGMCFSIRLHGMEIPRCCLTLHRVLGKAASPMSCAALAHAGHFPVLVEPWPGSDNRGQEDQMSVGFHFVRWRIENNK